MFKPKLLTNQVILTLFLGMALILLPLFIPMAHATESGRPDTVQKSVIPKPRAEPTPTPPSSEKSDNSESSDDVVTAIA